jgi:hypothetical protein
MNTVRGGDRSPAPLSLATVFFTRLMVQVMLDSTKEKTERERAIKKLIKKWRTTQETKGKASILLEKNPAWKTGQPKAS